VGDELTYYMGELTAEQLQREIAGFWAELEDNPRLRAEVEAAGIDSHLLGDLKDPHAITVRPDSSGADPEAVLLIIAFAPAGNRILKDLWATVLLPRIKRRWGDDAIQGETGRSGQ
jgi:hypothetical protein